MSHSYTPTPTVFSAITVPDDGDNRVAASVNLPLEQIADGLAGVTARRHLAYHEVFGGTDLGVHLIKGTTDTYVAGFLSSITTLVGDVVEIELSAWASYQYIGGAATTGGLTGHIRVNQNGGGAVYVPGSSRILERDFAASASIVAAMHLKAIKTITSAGTFASDTNWGFVDSPNVGDVCLVKEYSYLVKVWRG